MSLATMAGTTVFQIDFGYVSHTVTSPDLSHKPSRSLPCHQFHVPQLQMSSDVFPTPSEYYSAPSNVFCLFRCFPTSTSYLGILQPYFEMTSSYSVYVPYVSHFPSLQTCFRWNIHLVYTFSCFHLYLQSEYRLWFLLVFFSVWSVFWNRTLCARGHNARVEAKSFLLPSRSEALPTCSDPLLLFFACSFWNPHPSRTRSITPCCILHTHLLPASILHQWESEVQWFSCNIFNPFKGRNLESAVSVIEDMHLQWLPVHYCWRWWASTLPELM